MNRPSFLAAVAGILGASAIPLPKAARAFDVTPSLGLVGAEATLSVASDPGGFAVGQTFAIDGVYSEIVTVTSLSPLRVVAQDARVRG